MTNGGAYNNGNQQNTNQNYHAYPFVDPIFECNLNDAQDNENDQTDATSCDKNDCQKLLFTEEENCWFQDGENDLINLENG